MGGIIMRQFNLEEYVKNPIRPIVTRDGHAARIICTNRVDKTYSILALLFEDGDKDREEVYQYTSQGEYFPNASSPHDLFFAPEKKEGWINIYHYDGIENANAARRIYDTKEEALACKNKGRVDTIKIEWEE